nr:penicillin-binding transpeptidase domain-containing protein [Kineosphaera limosa]
MLPERGSLVGTQGTAFDPQESLARPVLGIVGAAGQEQADASGGRVEVGDPVGLSGVQAAQEATLAGTPGYVVHRVDISPGSTERHELTSVEPVAGNDVRVSLDAAVQRAAEQTLAAVGPPSAIVAVRPSDGHLLAVASGPGSQGYSTATLGRYAPGSTFKVVTAEALLSAGLTPDSVVQCTATTSAGGWPFRNYSDYPAAALGDIPLRTAIAQSCNTALINARDLATPQALHDAAGALGLLAEPRIGAPAYLGQVPTDGNETQHGAGLIGQGLVLASPLGMATVAASIGGGHTVAPQLVLPEQTPDAAEPEQPSGAPTAGADATSQVDAATGPPAWPPVPHAQALQQMMRGVVDGGTAAFLADVPGEPVLAKTGTAEYGTQTPPRTHAWMIAVQGDLAVAVFVEDGVSGSSTAGPLLETFLRAVP